MLKKLISIFFIVIATLTGVARAGGYETNYNGTWRGALQKIEPVVHSNALPDQSGHPEEVEFAIEVSENSTRVYLRWDGVWREIKPHAFGAAIHKTNAVIAATDSFFAGGGLIGWVETWSFTLTAGDDDSLYAYWVRAVNNPHLPDGSSPDARFVVSRFGTLKRSEPVTAENVILASTAPQNSECAQTEFICGHVRGGLGDDLERNQKVEQHD